MGKDLQDLKTKKKSFKRFLLSFKYSFDGLRYAFYNEQNIIIMFVVGILTMIFGIILKISYVERLVIVLLIGMILSLEMINTAIEAVVNINAKECKNAKIAKDCASGALSILCIFAVLIGLMIFVPKVIELIG